MNWFNYVPKARVDEARYQASKKIAEEQEKRRALECTVADLEEYIAELTDGGKRLAEVSGVQDDIVLGQLAMVQESTQWWRTLLTLIKGQTEMESANAIEPNLSAESRAYRAGRAAGLADFHQALIQLWQRAQKHPQ